jgi:hypothetical protein
MKKSVVRVCLAALLLAGLTIPALADGLPVPWPKKATTPVLRVTGNSSVLTQSSPKVVADGLPVPWPKKIIVSPQTMTQAPVLLADGLPVPWPKK